MVNDSPAFQDDPSSGSAGDEQSDPGLSRRLHLLEQIVQQSGEAVALISATDRQAALTVSYRNPRFHLLAANASTSFDEVFGESGLQLARHSSQQLAAIVRDEASFHGELSSADGMRSFKIDLIPAEPAPPDLISSIIFIQELADQHGRLVRVDRDALYDPVSSLPNRVLLFDHLGRDIAIASADQRPLCLLLVDLDRFQEINRAFGHQRGDQVLAQVGRRLGQQLAPAELISRIGGDEFVIVLPGADAGRASRLATRLLKALEAPLMIGDRPVTVGASIGIAEYPTHGVDATEIVRAAEVAMYSAKQSSSGFALFAGGDPAQSQFELARIGELREALTNDQLVVYYQPKIHLRSGLVTRVEALVRWQHPTEGLLYPAEFLPLAERSGLIRTISDWTLEQAIRQCRQWHDEQSPIHIAVNLPARSLQDPLLPLRVVELLERWRVEPRCLKLEITESSILADPQHAFAVLSLLQAVGVRLSIDDFGTGFSSLVHLRQLPVDEIKIDKSFVQAMLTSDADLAIVRATIELAHNLGRQVVAEGVEDEQTLQVLSDLGCDLVQGYYYSKAVPADELRRWLQVNDWGLSIGSGSRQS
jgi:diguanylate cyclase (GGDEF)-like protein